MAQSLKRSQPRKPNVLSPEPVLLMPPLPPSTPTRLQPSQPCSVDSTSITLQDLHAGPELLRSSALWTQQHPVLSLPSMQPSLEHTVPSSKPGSPYIAHTYPIGSVPPENPDYDIPLHVYDNGMPPITESLMAKRVWNMGKLKFKAVKAGELQPLEKMLGNI